MNFDTQIRFAFIGQQKMRDIRRTGEGCGLRGGQDKERMGCLLDDLRDIGINAN